MAEAAAPGNSRSQSQRRFYCHKCSSEITPNSQEYTCPRCHGGFVEEITGSGASSSRRPSRESLLPSTEEAASEFREVLHSMLTTAFNPVESQGGATRRSRRRRHTPYVEIRRRDQVEAEAASSPVATLRVVTGRGQPLMGGMFQHLMNRLGHPAALVGPAIPVNVMHIHGNPGDYAWGAGAMDAIVTQLLNQLDNYGPPPAEGDKIEALPTVNISQEQVDRTLQCSVCMDDFIFGESVRQLPCDHHYHSPCIVPWLKLHGTCPVCRKDLNGQDTSTTDDGSFPATNELNDRSISPTVDDPRT